MKGRFKHYVIDFYTRSGQLGRFCCKAKSKDNAICNALVHSDLFPYYIVKIYCLEYVYKLNH